MRIRFQESLGTATAALGISHVSQTLQKSLVSTILSHMQLSAPLCSAALHPHQHPLQAEHSGRLFLLSRFPHCEQEVSSLCADIL